MVIVIAALTILVMRDLVAGKWANKHSKRAPIVEQTLSTHPGGVGYLPTFPPEAVISFPELPAGVYSGTISRLIANEVLPLTIISYPETKTLALMIGIEGWTPRAITLDTGASDTVRVSSNGFILDFSVAPVQTTNIASEISGTFRNVVTGEIGGWKVKPVR
jgi:hypothetical protein